MCRKSSLGMLTHRRFYGAERERWRTVAWLTLNDDDQENGQ
jgi:hypothetical protein